LGNASYVLFAALVVRTACNRLALTLTPLLNAARLDDQLKPGVFNIRRPTAHTVTHNP
jgi:hypothetical protein